MATFLMVLSFVSMCCLFVGLIRPSLVIYWGKRSRRQVVVTYSILLFFLILFGGISSKPSTSSAEWYTGGSLHDKKGVDWIKASYENKLATCADFIAASSNQLDKRSAEQLVICIDKTVEESVAQKEDVSTLAATCIVLISAN